MTRLAIVLPALVAMFLLRSSPLGAEGPASRADLPKDPGFVFVSQVLATTEDVWEHVFKSMGRTYVRPKLVLYSDITRTECGAQQSISGPVYCERDSSVYLDLSFFRELELLKAPGDFGRAYVIAHEVGHHVQRLLGTLSTAGRLEASARSDSERNSISVRVELQADCLAGVWGGMVERMFPGVIEPGDIESGLAAASAVGNDRQQKAAFGTVSPETFTHGTSDQRMRWFKKGYVTSQVQACDTFAAGEL